MNHLAQPSVLDRVEQKCEDDGNREGKQQILDAQNNGVGNDGLCVEGGEELFEMLQPHPGATGNAALDAKILKGDD